MKLLIVESPSKAKTINTYLGKDFKVISSFGHVRGLPSQEGSVDADKNFQMKYEVLDKAKKHVDEIVKNARKAEEIYLATDPDREGEAISWHIVEILKTKNSLLKDVKLRRVVFNEITKTAVKEAVENPRDLDDNLVHAQQTRQALDYLVGFTLSPVLWRKLPGSRSAGRVQSVALKIICERESEIEKFKSQEYWSITGNFLNSSSSKIKSSLITYQGIKLDKFDIKDSKQADGIVKEIKKSNFHVGSVEKKQARRFPPPPFTTSTMLQEAARKLGFSASKTSRTAQSLYEGIEVGGNTMGLITYMRTDSVTVSKEAVTSVRKAIGSKYGDKYVPEAPRAYKTKTKNAQEAHEAIRPTDFTMDPSKVAKYLSDDQAKLYELIWKRMLASQMENAVLDMVSVDIVNQTSDIVFRATGSSVVFDGYYVLYREGLDDSDDEDEQKLPVLNKDEVLDLQNVEPNQHFTQPPPRYTEASLVKKMEEIGIGRPSTYPAIISILQDREYVRIDKKRFFPESKGRIVTAFLTKFFTKYVEYDFTANLENELDEIADATVNWQEVLTKFWRPFKDKTEEVLKIQNLDVVAELDESLSEMLFPDGASRKCPTCHKGELGLRTGKFGAFVGCSNYPECKHIQQIGKMDSDNEIPTNTQFPKVLGKNPDGEEVSLRKGPYGLYVQLGDGKKVKRTGLPKGSSPEKVNLEYALGLLSLPRELGKHPETGEVIKAGIGRFGPYLLYQSSFRSLKTDDPIEVSLDRAVEILSQTAPVSRRAKKSKK
jgi:DNA topoisomerase-1